MVTVATQQTDNRPGGVENSPGNPISSTGGLYSALVPDYISDLPCENHTGNQAGDWIYYRLDYNAPTCTNNDWKGGGFYASDVRLENPNSNETGGQFYSSCVTTTGSDFTVEG